jgi:site-specific DNA-methyltransferase (adenine-specific)
MSERVEIGPCVLYRGRCEEVLPSLERGSVDCVITDPPYSSGGAFRSDRMRPGKEKAVGAGYVGGAPPVDRPEFLGDNRDQRSFLRWCALWLGECLDVTRPGGAACVFTDWRQLPTVTDALQVGGWVWRGIGVWDKTEAARPQKGCFRSQCEYFAWGTAGPIGLLWPDAGAAPCLPGVFRQSVAGDEKLHVAGKPLAVMRGVVQICPPGGVILDPFAGSGTTLEAALREGRRAIGIEMTSAYFDVACRRVEAAVRDARDQLFPAPAPAAAESPVLFPA